MANTVNLGKATRATAGRRQFGQRSRRLIGLAAIALLALGLAGAGIVSRARPAAVPQASTNPFANDPHVNTVWDFREDRRDPAPTDAPALVPASGPVPADASTTGDFRWNYGVSDAPPAPSGLVPAFDWEQQERTQVAPGTLPTSPTILPGSCQPGTSDCPLTEYQAPGAAPSAPVSVPGPWLGTCRAGSSDCLPDEDYPPDQGR
jgi:hypothetical protein